MTRIFHQRRDWLLVGSHQCFFEINAGFLRRLLDQIPLNRFLSCFFGDVAVMSHFRCIFGKEFLSGNRF